jgi:hypothetical protein
MALVVACHYPLQLFASRKCALTLWQSITETENPWRFIYFSVRPYELSGPSPF